MKSSLGQDPSIDRTPGSGNITDPSPDEARSAMERRANIASQMQVSAKKWMGPIESPNGNKAQFEAGK